jgi:hypothetical protein
MVDPNTVWGAFVLRVADLRRLQQTPLEECTCQTFAASGVLADAVDWMLECILDGDAPPEAPFEAVVKSHKGGEA